ncbi:N2227-like protein-domain-containing protein [Dipodascopsis tothii]|uniref:N2227-like protein-domain-containing protein n=1 Tax=Dipodascopsis tothii TaxID=44089 RepID=UPI0034CE328B
MDDSDRQADQNALTATLNSFYLYRRAAHHNVTGRRRELYARMSERHRAVLAQTTGFLHNLEQIDVAIDQNSGLLELVAQIGANEFEAPQDRSEWASASTVDMDKAQGTLKQIYRDWSAEGERERATCYGPLLAEIDRLVGDGDRRQVRVLVPGCGLGRLPFELAANGYTAQGNEFSYHMLVASYFFLNHTTLAGQFRVYPFVGSFSHLRTHDDQLAAFAVPDVVPAAVFAGLAADDADPAGLPRFSMTAGAFVDVYSDPAMAWDVVATAFFIDTAPNVLEYIETIRAVLARSSASKRYWVNCGPLLWHFESGHDDQPAGIELPMADLVKVIESYGFVFDKLEHGIQAAYATNPRAQGSWVYNNTLWVARLADK